MGLKITAEVNYKTVNFLDVTLNLNSELYKPYRKPNNEPIYIHKESNHPPSIIKHLSAAINRRIASLSSDKGSFDSVAPIYDLTVLKSKIITIRSFNTVLLIQLLQLKPFLKRRSVNVREMLSGSTHPIAKPCEPMSPEIS